MSDALRQGLIVDECEKLLGWRPDMVTLNTNVVCKPHVDRNKGISAICFLGSFKGGALLVQEPEEIKRYEEPYKWHYFNGRHLHWNEEITEGTKYSVVCYKK